MTVRPGFPDPSLIATLIAGGREDRGLAARSPALSLEQFSLLAADPVPLVRETLARNLALPASLLEPLSADQAKTVRTQVAARADCPPVLLATLATDPSAGVRLAVASHPATPKSSISILEEDEDFTVLTAASLHALGHGDVPALLAAGDAEFRLAAAAHRGLSPEAFELLARQYDTDPLAAALVGNPSVPFKVVVILSRARRRRPRGFRMLADVFDRVRVMTPDLLASFAAANAVVEDDGDPDLLVAQVISEVAALSDSTRSLFERLVRSSSTVLDVLAATREATTDPPVRKVKASPPAHSPHSR